jgi:ABC-2 type transport system permease protein
VVAVPQLRRSFGFVTSFRQTLTIARFSFGKIARNPAGLAPVGVIALASAVFGSRIMAQFEIPLLPGTQQVLNYLTAPVGEVSSPWVVIPLLLMYFSGALVWTERDAGLSDITGALPVSNWVFLTGKFLGLGLIIVVWMALLMLGGILMQAGLGNDKPEISLYLKVLFGLQLTDYLLFALLTLVVQAVVNERYTGYLLMFLVFSFISFPSTFQVEHSMLIFGKDPGWWYTDMRGFGPTVGPWLWFKVYWILWAVLLALAAGLLWVRGREQSFKRRLQLAKRHFTGAVARITIMALGLLFAVGSFIFYQTNVLNEYLTGTDIDGRRAEYERLYGRYRNTPQPLLTATKLWVEIYPDLQQAEIRAAYTLMNKDTVPIDSIHLGSVSGLMPEKVNFSRSAACVLRDKKLNHHIYALEHPLAPGDSLQLNFVVHYIPPGFLQSGTSPLVVENGSCLTNLDLLPDIGYQRYRELNDAVTRKKYKLAARPRIPSLDDPEALKKPVSTGQYTFEAIVGTAKEQVAVTPGALKRSWTKGSRRYFHFKTDAFVRGGYSILSAKYAVQESRWNNVAIRIYHHPGHAGNIGRMLRSLKASLEYYTEQFGPYPYGHITVVERAGGGDGAGSEAAMITYGEQYSMMNPDDGADGFDLPYYILAHEVAHQWWGGAGLTPANVEGAGFLVEGLAVFSGMQVLEKNYGEGHLRKYLDFLHSFYEMPRSPATASLLRADESFLYYRKGGVAMYTLSRYIGKKKVNGALRQLLRRHRSGALPLPTSLDLYQELQKVTPDSLHDLLEDLFEKNTYWRLKTRNVAVSRTKAGYWQAILKVQAQKVVVDKAGHENEVPMNDWLEVGIYEEGKGANEPLYRRKHRIRSGEQTIKVTVPGKPGRAGIDPDNLMIDLRPEDNIKAVKPG